MYIYIFIYISGNYGDRGISLECHHVDVSVLEKEKASMRLKFHGQFDVLPFFDDDTLYPFQPLFSLHLPWIVFMDVLVTPQNPFLLLYPKI